MTTAMVKNGRREVRAWDPLQAVRDEVETLWSHVFGDRASNWLGTMQIPPLDLVETAESIEVKVDLPGIKASDINVQINNNVLTISGQRIEESKKDTATCHRMERRIGEFSRSVTLPVPVDENKIDAQCRDGILTVSMQKAADAKSHQIKVKG